MTGFVITGVVLAYVTLGVIFGRVVFVQVLGDRSRRDGSYGVTHMSSAYIAAFWTALASLVVWPVTLPVVWMTHATPTERLARERRELKEREREVEALARRHRLPTLDGVE